MTRSLPDRLAAARSSASVAELVELGGDLSEAGEHLDAAWCFQTALRRGDAVAAFNLGNELVALDRDRDSVPAYEAALAAGVDDAWLNLGLVLERLGDLAGALRAFEQGNAAGDANAGIAHAFLLREVGERASALAVIEHVARAGSALADAVAACWRYDTTLDPALEARLRAGMELHPGARVDLADILRRSARVAEAVAVLERGVELGEADSYLPLGNVYADDLGEPVMAEAIYRRGIAAGDTYCHHNLGALLEDQGRLDEARHHYALGADAGDALAQRALAELDD